MYAVLSCKAVIVLCIRLQVYIDFTSVLNLQVYILLHVMLAVTAVKFANDDKSRVACGSVDSTLSICQVIPPPATVICMLRGHAAAVCGEYPLSLITSYPSCS